MAQIDQQYEKLVEKAREAAKRRNYDYAIDLYMQVLKLNPDHGDAAKELRKVTVRKGQEEGVSAIVIGSHGRSNVAEMLIGSVSERVVRRSNVPVLVIKR